MSIGRNQNSAPSTSAPRIRFLSGPQVRALLRYDDLVTAMDLAMREVSTGGCLLPLRQVLAIPDTSTRFGTMLGYLNDPACFGVKVVALRSGRGHSGACSHTGLVLLFDARAGRPVAILDAGELTRIRTAVVSVLATRTLARGESRTLAILGTGEQASEHLAAMIQLLPWDTVVVWGRDLGKADAMMKQCEVPARISAHCVASVEEAVRQADVICTATSAADPILKGCWIRPGTHLCLVGSSVATDREVDDDCVRRSRFFVDYRRSAFEQAGELLHAIRCQTVTADHVAAELGEVLNGTKAGRRSPDEITVYKSLGLAAQDLAAATLIL
ncbi:MAG: ornithine cyclodeaminase family protein, partial [Steroidobacteraceae bacterium]